MKKITVDSKEMKAPTGLVSGGALYDIAQCGEGGLYFNREDKIDIPVAKSDFIVIYGGESFVTGKPGAIDDNPQLRNPVCPEFNGKKEGVSLPVAKNLGKELKSKDDKFPEDGRLYVDLPDAVDEEIGDDVRIIVQSRDSYFVIPPSKDESGVIDVEECVKHGTRIPRGKQYRIRIDGEKHTSKEMVVTGASILGIVGKAANEWSLNQKLKGGARKAIGAGDSIDLSACGVERFETVRLAQQQGNE